MDVLLVAGRSVGPRSLDDAGPCTLLRRCLGQRREADWRRFVTTYGHAIVRLVGEVACRFGLRIPDDELEEVAQDLYVGFLGHDGKVFDGRDERQFWQYLRRCVRHRMIDRVRYQRAIKRGGRRLGDEEERRRRLPPVASRPPGFHGTCDRRDPEVRALQREDLETFRRGFRRYGEQGVEVLDLVFVEGLTSREVSHALGGEVAPRQVDNLVQRFRRDAARDGLEVPRRCPGRVLR